MFFVVKFGRDREAPEFAVTPSVVDFGAYKVRTSVIFRDMLPFIHFLFSLRNYRLNLVSFCLAGELPCLFQLVS